MPTDDKHWHVREPELSRNVVRVRAEAWGGVPSLRWEELRDVDGRILQMTAHHPCYFMLTPNTPCPTPTT